jgi:hypothetical protein
VACDKGDAGIAKIRETDGIPSRLALRLFAVGQRTDVLGNGRDHRFDHIAGLGHAYRNRRLLVRRDRDTDPTAKPMRQA